MKSANPMYTAAHFHILPTPLIATRRWAARELRRKLERDQIRGKVPIELMEAKFAVHECRGSCMEGAHPSGAAEGTAEGIHSEVEEAEREKD